MRNENCVSMMQIDMEEGEGGRIKCHSTEAQKFFKYACESLGRAVELEPGRFEWTNYYASLLFWDGNITRSVSILEKFCSREAQNGNHYLNALRTLIRVYKMSEPQTREEDEKRERLLIRLCELDPLSESGFENLARRWARNQVRNRDAVIALAKRRVEIMPEQCETWDFLLEVLLTCERPVVVDQSWYIFYFHPDTSLVTKGSDKLVWYKSMCYNLLKHCFSAGGNDIVLNQLKCWSRDKPKPAVQLLDKVAAAVQVPMEEVRAAALLLRE